MRTFVLILAGCVISTLSLAQESGEKTAKYRVSSEAKAVVAPGTHYARALKLYEQGPSKAEEIIAELDLELKDQPESLKALSLKANTQIGVGQYDAALATLDRYDAITAKADTVSPTGIFLRARCLYHKGDFAAAKLRLEPYWAFFQQDPASKAKYDGLMAAILAELPKPSAK
jgi:predicted Zn-dependent protease